MPPPFRAARRLPFYAVVLLLASCTAASPVAVHPADEPALIALNNTFHALQSIDTLQMDFLCRKDLVGFDTPLITTGTLIAARPDDYRFSTLKPYLSEILQQGPKVFRKTQHETTWDKSDLQTRPTLNTVAGQLGAWSLGQANKLTDFYAVSWAQDPLPPPPGEDAPSQPVDTFILTPTAPDLQKLVSQMTLAFSGKSHFLIAARLSTQQGDTMTFWFSPPRVNIPLPPDTFTPK